MTPKEKAQELVEKMFNVEKMDMTKYCAKQCALIAAEIEYNSLREQLLNLRSCHVIENGKVFLARIDLLNQEESQVKAEIESI